MNSSLANRVEVEFSRLFKPIKGKKPKNLFDEHRDKLIPYIDIKAFEKNELRKFASPEESRLVNERDIIIVWDGARSGLVGKGVAGALGSTLGKFECNDHIDHRYLYYFLLSKYDLLNSNTKGTGIPHLNPDFLGEMMFPLVPLEEQNRVSDRLDSIFEKLKLCETKLNVIPEKLSQLSSSLIVQAFNGRLSDECKRDEKLTKSYIALLESEKNKLKEQKLIKTEKESENKSEIVFDCPSEWEIVKLSSLCVSISDGDHQAPPKAETGIPFLVIGNVSDGRLDLSRATRFVPESYFDKLTGIRKPKKNDVLYSVTGSYGIPILVSTEEKFCFQRHIGILRSLENVNPKYLFYLLKHPYVYAQATSCATGTAQLTVPLGGLRAFNVPIMPTEEQNVIVEKIEGLLTKVDILNQQYEYLLERFEIISKSILKRAFNGDLVEGSSESVNELLQSIENLLSKSSKRKKGSRKSKK